MGLIYRKTISRGPVRFTITEKGVGASIGYKCIRFGVSTSGRSYVSVGIPGTGIRYVTDLTHPK